MAKHLGRALRRYFLTGLVVLAPLTVTLYVLVTGFEIVDSVLGNLLTRALGRPIPGIGAAAALAVTFGVGLIAANVLGRRLISFGERILARIPLVRTVYLSVKQVVDALTLQRSAFKRVVMIEYPRRGLHSVGFLTGNGIPGVAEKAGGDVVTVFVPTTPNPTSGWFVLVPRDECIFLDMNVEDAFKMIISGGMVVPPKTMSDDVSSQEIPSQDILGKDLEIVEVAREAQEAVGVKHNSYANQQQAGYNGKQVAAPAEDQERPACPVDEDGQKQERQRHPSRVRQEQAHSGQEG